TTFNNTATISYSSLDGDFTDPAYNPNDDVTTDRERIVIETSNTVTVTIPSSLSLTKSVIDTSHHTIDGATTGTQLAIGETATFRLQTTLQEGTTARLTLTDTVPAGLRYVAGTAIFRSDD